MKRRGIEKPIMHWLIIDHAKTISQRVKKVQLMFIWKVPYFSINGQSH